jgi:hypothetical protein
MANYFQREYNTRSRLPTEVEYVAMGEPQDVGPSSLGGHTGAFPVAKLAVQIPSARALFDNSDYHEDTDDLDYDYLDEDPDYDDLAELSARRLGRYMGGENYHPDDIAAAKESQRNTPQMFHTEPAEVLGLFADPSMRHTVGTLGGLALNQFGKTLRASDSLSKHSSRLVQRGVKAGLIDTHPANPFGNATNAIDHREVFETHALGSPTGNTPGGYDFKAEHQEIPKPRLDAARKTIHGMLRPKTSPEQFGALNKLEYEKDTPYNPSTDKNAMQIPGMDY